MLPGSSPPGAPHPRRSWSSPVWLGSTYCSVLGHHSWKPSCLGCLAALIGLSPSGVSAGCCVVALRTHKKEQSEVRGEVCTANLPAFSSSACGPHSHSRAAPKSLLTMTGNFPNFQTMWIPAGLHPFVFVPALASLALSKENSFLERSTLPLSTSSDCFPKCLFYI